MEEAEAAFHAARDRLDKIDRAERKRWKELRQQVIDLEAALKAQLKDEFGERVEAAENAQEAARSVYEEAKVNDAAAKAPLGKRLVEWRRSWPFGTWERTGRRRGGGV